jgi:hypothetical protein
MNECGKNVQEYVNGMNECEESVNKNQVIDCIFVNFEEIYLTANRT